MMTTSYDSIQGDTSKLQYWKHPETNVVHETYNQPRSAEAWEQAQPILDLNVVRSNVRLAREGKQDEMSSPFMDTKFQGKVDDYVHDVRAGGRQRQAALFSPTNKGVDIVNIFSEVFGKLERKFAAKNMAREIPVPNLIIEIDSVRKFTGMTEIGELGDVVQKELPYQREHFEAKKFGLKFQISEESQLKNVHNPLEDSMQIAGTKVEQRASFDVAAACKTLPTITGKNWGSFDVGTDHSTANPLDDLLNAVSRIEGTGAGAKADHVGFTLFTNSKFVTNTHIRGVANTGIVPNYEFEPGTTQMLGMDGVGLVLDNSFGQGIAYITSVAVEPSIAYFQGPQRVGSRHNEFSGSDEYFIVDYHRAARLSANTDTARGYSTGYQISGVSTPVDFSSSTAGT